MPRTRTAPRAASAQALANATGPHGSLNGLLRSCIEFTLNQGHLIGVLVGEPGRLPEKEREAARQAQRDCPALWVRRLDEVRPGLDAAEVKIVVNAMFTMVDNVPRTGRIGERTDMAARLTDLGTALFLDEGHPGAE
ncbi:hypothetical protein [Streptomyces sp. NPDC048411]|uniref:hypothetical protein n=1 Tax=Streptomyces sp. NPDC048411 TaxID=3157206 RepID=UPI0034541494